MFNRNPQTHRAIYLKAESNQTKNIIDHNYRSNLASTTIIVSSIIIIFLYHLCELIAKKCKRKKPPEKLTLKARKEKFKQNLAEITEIKNRNCQTKSSVTQAVTQASSASQIQRSLNTSQTASSAETTTKTQKNPPNFPPKKSKNAVKTEKIETTLTQNFLNREEERLRLEKRKKRHTSTPANQTINSISRARP